MKAQDVEENTRLAKTPHLSFAPRLGVILYHEGVSMPLSALFFVRLAHLIIVLASIVSGLKPAVRVEVLGRVDLDVIGVPFPILVDAVH